MKKVHKFYFKMLNTKLFDLSVKINILGHTVCHTDAGKYMVKAVNDAGETQSIADFIILEPTPERVIDTVQKIVTVENIDRQRVCTMYMFFFKYCEILGNTF